MRVLLTGWASFRRGEATAGDVLSLRAVSDVLAEAGVDHVTAWSPGFRPEGPHLEDAHPDAFSHVVFACGPLHGAQLNELHERYAHCRRVAVGVSVPDPHDPAATGFDAVLARDDGDASTADLSLAAWLEAPPAVGVLLAPDQPEYGADRRHQDVHETLTGWLRDLDCGRVELDTRLATDDWRHCSTPDQFVSVAARLDVLVSTRLHGLVLGLKAGVPVLAVDPVAHGGKVTAQAAALGWPAILPAAAGRAELDEWFEWCCSAEGRARAAGEHPYPGPLAELVGELKGLP
ncbi:polysaccharide pyruvyl transferase family protein [Amycolatopsis benzoatilytica]|uniref:polysaccharide pyruvyl transferase family protein n=1 Tax=Amycolatopsis benzoatilytica TaxID=346045 RepID=UPI0004875E79|nr:polysaccharide pyruvyl transferase family protein [Amycolatopsis benzoatilytica]